MSARLMALLLVPALLLGCGTESASVVASEEVAVGAYVDDGTALPAGVVAAEPDVYAGRTVTLEGRIAEVCTKKGCWLALDTGAQPIRVTVPRTVDGYAFTVPTDAAGRAVVTGRLTAVAVDATTRAHLADDGATAPAATELRLAARGIEIVPLEGSG